MGEEEIKETGKITHYFTKAGVAVVELSSTLFRGDKIRIKGMTTDFEQTVNSMQIEHEQIQKAKKGDSTLSSARSTQIISPLFLWGSPCFPSRPTSSLWGSLSFMLCPRKKS